jgi:ubiquinone/menaquinone biosynthesis C-methylase UbiE
MCPSFYAAFVDPFLKDIRLFVPAFAAMKPGDRVLDVCCGTGDQAFHYAAGGMEAYGIDLDEAMIAQAEESKEKRNLKASFSVQDAAALSFGDGSFDFATVSMALHEKDAALEDAVIAEMRRVTGKGRALVLVDFSVPLPRNFPGLLMRSVEFMVGGEHYRNFRAFLKSGGLDGLVRRNGLKVLKKNCLKDGALTALLVAAA